jgi:hypothetical protein
MFIFYKVPNLNQITVFAKLWFSKRYFVYVSKLLIKNFPFKDFLKLFDILIDSINQGLLILVKL